MKNGRKESMQGLEIMQRKRIRSLDEGEKEELSERKGVGWVTACTAGTCARDPRSGRQCVSKNRTPEGTKMQQGGSIME